MIDWWASKMGMLIFLTVVLGSLLTFAAMQIDALSGEKEYRTATDIGRMIDSVGSMEGSYTEYKIEIDSYTLNIFQDHLSFNDKERFFTSNAKIKQ